MEEKFEFTKAELTEAFRLYNVDYLENPEDYVEIDKSKESAESQAEKLLSFLPVMASGSTEG